ncbi:uncharacterized protein Z519_11568 [Cladophialophora bantiana CBS 173.52]|uniref:Uncharacterized protein n=1 Tax=Cladophialophora bantiana (strain ATCC 10958 / CBS 173.52 / CDC B-1940 / NIH 8579) TaxID=1442370 RepID=A0A0D2H3W7_CLAB1|nr:uncharacterized protein Z519_11568 [Cladophialophora bantiana CBS 173.52]KIW87983.1 hypothetical protein Z519_11568 [Cladophialophora bantiana CBS 173.52]
MISVEERQTGSATNPERLPDEVRKSRRNSTFKFAAEKASRGGYGAIIVFSIPLDIGYGNLLDLFVNASIADANLNTTSTGHHYKPLSQDLSDANVVNEDAAMEAFKKRNGVSARWFLNSKCMGNLLEDTSFQIASVRQSMTMEDNAGVSGSSSD